MESVCLFCGFFHLHDEFPLVEQMTSERRLGDERFCFQILKSYIDYKNQKNSTQF